MIFSRSRSNAHRGRRRGGWSIIELLVVLGILGVLIAIIVPSLSGVRARGREAVSLAHLRQIHTAFEAYLSQHKEVYPWAPAGAELLLSPPDEPFSSITPGYWDLERYWPSLLHEVAPWRQWFATFLGPGAQRGDPPWTGRGDFLNGVPSYRLSHTFFARPEVWTGAASSDALFRPVRAGEVLFPSSKIMLVDQELAHLAALPKADRDLRPMLAADGSAAVRRVSEAARPPTVSFKPDTRPIFDTPQGVRGRDY